MNLKKIIFSCSVVTALTAVMCASAMAIGSNPTITLKARNATGYNAGATGYIDVYANDISDQCSLLQIVFDLVYADTTVVNTNAEALKNDFIVGGSQAKVMYYLDSDGFAVSETEYNEKVQEMLDNGDISDASEYPGKITDPLMSLAGAAGLKGDVGLVWKSSALQSGEQPYFSANNGQFLGTLMVKIEGDQAPGTYEISAELRSLQDEPGVYATADEIASVDVIPCDFIVKAPPKGATSAATAGNNIDEDNKVDEDGAYTTFYAGMSVNLTDYPGAYVRISKDGKNKAGETGYEYYELPSKFAGDVRFNMIVKTLKENKGSYKYGVVASDKTTSVVSDKTYKLQ